MKSKVLVYVLLAGVGLITSGYPVAQAAPGAAAQSVTSGDSNRMGNKLGMYLGISEPAPTLLGINLGYNITDYLRASAGVGQMSVSLFDAEAKVTSIGAGARFFVPGWSLSPTAGAHFGTVFYSGQEGLISVGGFKKNGSHVYLSVGVDYQAKGGFNFATGLIQSLRAGVGTSFYLSAGWFIDWLG